MTSPDPAVPDPTVVATAGVAPPPRADDRPGQADDRHGPADDRHGQADGGTAGPDLVTSASDYDERYYRSGLGPDYDASEPHWARFFGDVAEAIVSAVSPATALDAGCAKGFLVKALLDRGVDAHGVDVSDYAIGAASGEVRDRVTVHDLTEPLEGRWDLITCIEVLEHMAPTEAEQAIDNLCAATDNVVLASTPHDFVEPTHVNVRPSADWAASFARRGFFRRPGVDLSALAPWATLFERRSLSPADVVRLYETELAPVREEAVVKTQALLDTQRRLDELSSEVPIPGGANQLDRVLGLVDQVLGLQAELTAARADADKGAQTSSEMDARPYVWTAGQTRSSLEATLAREQEIRRGLERRLRALEVEAKANDEIQRSRAFRAAMAAARGARVARRIAR